MNFRRILVASGSHLWRRACTTVAAPASANVKTSVTAPSAVAGVKATSDGTWAKVAAREQRKKRKMLEKLRNLKVLGGTVKGTLNALMKSEEEERVSITQADLVRWAKLLDKDGKHKYACQIFEWMERKKMTFSPEELATYVDLIARTKGVAAAEAYFKKVDPDFDDMDPNAKNWPAYWTLSLMYLKRWDRHPSVGFAHLSSTTRVR